MKHFSCFTHKWLLGLLLILTGPAAWAQSVSWQMAVAASGNNSIVTATAADANGNVYVAGYFSGTVAFGNNSLRSAGGSDLFVAKWNVVANGFEWVHRAGGTGEEYINGIAVNGSNVYLAGGFYSTAVTFDLVTLNNTSLTGVTQDAFVAKLVDTGGSSSFTWAQRVGGAGDDYASAVAVSGAAVYIAGSFNSTTAMAGSISLVNSSSSTGTYNMFVAKLIDNGPTGSFAWAQSAGGNFATSLAVSGSALYVAGSFFGAATFGSLTLQSTFGGFDAFVVKLADAGSAGTFIWAQRGGGADYDEAVGVAVSGTSIYVTGDFLSVTASFGNVTLTNASTTRNTPDVFITKLTDAGASASYTWSQRAGSPAYEYAKGILVSGANVYVTGYFRGAAAIFGNTSLPTGSVSATAGEAFVTKLMDTGSNAIFSWATRAGGAGEDVGRALALRGATLYVAGAISPPATFDGFAISGPTGPNVQAAFLAALTDPTITATNPAMTAAAVDMFPNPAHGRATVQLPAIPGTATATLTVLDALGRALRTQSAATSARTELDLTGLAPGLYAVRVAAGSSTATQRLVVE